MRLRERFFARQPLEVAQDLVGRTLVREIGTDRYEGIITETAAYEGRSGRTAGNGIAYAPGKFYIMPYRGRYFLNIATEAEGVDSCVQIRRIKVGDEELGPMQLTRRLQIDNSFDGISVENYLMWIEGQKDPKTRIHSILLQEEKMARNCLGYYKLRL